ncbi:MAG: ABC transporter ATP-binding protein [Caldisericaceae bacterium]
MLKLYKNLKPFILLILGAFALQYLQVTANLELPTLMANIVNNGIMAGDISYIWKQGLMMLLIAGGGIIAAMLASLLASRTAMGLGRDIRSKFFKQVENFSLHEFNQFGASTLLTRTTNDVVQIQQTTFLMIAMLANAVFTSVEATILAYNSSPQLTKILYVALPVIFIFIAIIVRPITSLFSLVQKQIDKINKVMRENVMGVRVIRAFNRIDHEKKRFAEANSDVTNTYIKVNRIIAGLMPLMMIVLNIVNVAILWYGSKGIEAGNTNLGSMIAFMQYSMMILFSLVMLTMLFIMVPRGAAAADRVVQVLETKPEIKDKTETAHEVGENGHIEFCCVSFSYSGAEEPVLKDVSFEAKPGETTAVIGSTGCGKSTLIQLIPRFYDVADGKVAIDGIDVRDYSQSDLRKKIGYVPQKAILFTGTVADNIRYGKEDATDEEVKHAAEVAQAAEFIDTMPEGYNTMLSEGGLNLSGGQKQRLAIARAIVRKPEIYIFDDSFSALDFKTEAKLRAALKQETKDSTVIIVGQRVASIMSSDRIVVLEKGRVAGVGTHKELMETCEVYREIVYSQLSKEELA